MTKIISQDDLIKQISNECGEKQSTIKKMFECLENILPDILLGTNEGTDIQIKILDGISLNCKYQAESEYVHPGTQKNMIREAKIWTKPHVTRYFNKKLNHLKNIKSK